MANLVRLKFSHVFVSCHFCPHSINRTGTGLAIMFDTVRIPAAAAVTVTKALAVLWVGDIAKDMDPKALSHSCLWFDCSHTNLMRAIYAPKLSNLPAAQILGVNRAKHTVNTGDIHEWSSFLASTFICVHSPLLSAPVLPFYPDVGYPDLPQSLYCSFSSLLHRGLLRPHTGCA